MASAIIAGIPRDIQRRVKNAISAAAPAYEGWSILWLASKNDVPGLALSQVDDAMALAAKHGGAHLLLFTGRPPEIDRQVRDLMRPHFRIRKLSNHLLTQIPHQPEKLLTAIMDVLKEELEWQETVKPKNETSCILLPECSFDADRSVRGAWALALEQDAERIRAAAKAQERFEGSHWRHFAGGNRRWTDRQGRVFGHSGPRHGTASFPRNWKLSFRIPDGFHFDVTHHENRPFTLTDRVGTQHTIAASGYLNVDPHGHPRV